MNGKIKAVITGSVMVIAIAVSSVAAQADDPGWNKDERGWWFKEADGSYPMEQWRLIGSAWNYFDSDGYMVTGWKQLNGEWYYFNSDGYMQTGWQQIDDKWYYFDGAGVMTTGELTIGGTDYYFADDGVMQDAAEQVADAAEQVVDAAEQVADAAEQSADAAEQGRQEDIQLPAAADNSNPFSNNSLLFDENEAGNTESSPADSDIKKSMVTFNSDGTYSVKNLHIPEDAAMFNGHYYYYFDGADISWNSAWSLCFAFGGYLVSITSEEEQKFLEDQYPGTTGWIGASLKDGVWQWMNQEPFEYTNWKAGEPNNQNGEEGYAHFYTDMKWNDLPGDDTAYHNGFYCEWNSDIMTYNTEGLFGGQISEETEELLERGKGCFYGTGPDGYDIDEAWECFSTAVGDYSSQGWYYMGQILREERKDTKNMYVRALGSYERAVEYGSPLGWVGLGLMYHKGKAVHADYEKAGKFYELALELGCSEANAFIGDLYYYGDGVEKDLAKAEEYYKKALECEDFGCRGYARFSLGYIYLDEASKTGADYVKAMKWFLEGAMEGNYLCCYNVGWMYENGKGGVKEDQAQAFYWYLQGALRGNINAMYKVGLMYEEGSGTARDLDAARNWYSKVLSDPRANDFLKENVNDAYARIESAENGQTQDQGGTYADTGKVIIDYRQDGTPVYADDYQAETQPWESPYFVGYTQDGTPQYDYGGYDTSADYGYEYDYNDGYQAETQPWESPYFVGYTQDGTPQYDYGGYDTSADYGYDYDYGYQAETQPWESPYFVGYTQDGTPQYSY